MHAHTDAPLKPTCTDDVPLSEPGSRSKIDGRGAAPGAPPHMPSPAASACAASVCTAAGTLCAIGCGPLALSSPASGNVGSDPMLCSTNACCRANGPPRSVPSMPSTPPGDATCSGGMPTGQTHHHSKPKTQNKHQAVENLSSQSISPGNQ